LTSRPRRGRLPLVTLSSDVGAAYAAQMKAVLARSVDPGRVVDLAHDLTPHAVAEAAFVVRAMAVGFPPGTIHVVVVDPGVGGARIPVVVACAGGTALVGPDNGVLYPLAEALGEIRAYRIDPERLDHRRVGATFDGRDIFAPAAAALARGTPASRLGPRVEPTRFRLPAPNARGAKARGEVVHADRFGNLITNVPSTWLRPTTRSLRVTFAGRARTVPVASSYEALGPGSLGVLRSSFGTLEIAVAGGRASDRLRARPGAPIELAFEPGRRVRPGR
jgi:S-adenosyl-L-methionine hydrolase (adenosine-forming)